MSPDPTPTDRPGALLRLLPLALALGLWAALVARSNYLIDDAFISFRYARNWSEIGVPAYNLGVQPPVEGYSNFLWVLLLRAAYGAGQNLEVISRVLSILAAGTAVVLVEGALARAGLGLVARTLGLLALAASTPFAVWSTGGLETALFGLLMLGTFLVQASAPGRGERARGLLGGMLAVALALTRPEGFLWVIGLWVCARIARSSGPGQPKAEDSLISGRGRDSAFLLTYLLGFCAYLAWRHSTHGDWLPNTVYAKAGMSSDSLGRGLRYVGSFLVLCPVTIVALVAAPFARGPRQLALGSLGMVFGGLAYSLASGGDWMPFFRFLAPVAPFVALLLALGVERAPRLLGPVAAAAILLGVLPIYDKNPVPESVRSALDFRGFGSGYLSEWQRWERGERNLANFSGIGRALAQVSEPGDSITFGAIGAIGWYSDLYVHDRNGLVDRDVARLPATATRASAGHDKRVPRAWFLDRKPTYFHAILVNVPIPDMRGRAFQEAMRAINAKVFVQDPGEEDLKGHCLPQVYPLKEAPGIAAGSTLVVLRYTEDKAAARAFWGP